MSLPMSSAVKKRKIDQEHRQFKKAGELKTQLTKQQGVFAQKKKESECATFASYKVAQLIARSARPFTDGDFVKDCLMEICEAVCKEKKDAFTNVPLSRMSIQQRIVDMADNCYSQLKMQCKDVKFFSAALESTDASDPAQLLIFIRGVNNECKVFQELASLVSLHGRSTGADIFNAFQKVIDGLNLPWDTLVGVMTDGAPAMVGEQNGFIGCLKRHLGEKAVHLKNYHCIIHQEALCAKHLKFTEVMDFVVKTVNFVRARSLNHRLFEAFLEEVKAVYGDVLYHTDVRWLSRGNVLKRFFALRHEIKAFLDEKGMDTSVMQDIDWVADFAFLTDLTGHLNDLNLKLQGSQNLISDLFEAVCAFEIKLRLLTAQLEKGLLVHYPACAEVFPHDQYAGWYRHVNVLKQLQNVFENSFTQFKSNRVSYKLFADPFSADVDSVQPELQLEVIDLQCCSALKTKYRDIPLLAFYQSLDTAQFPNLSREALKIYVWQYLHL